jgi:hypothetical protein
MKASGGSDALPALFRRSFRNSLYAKLSRSDNILTAWVEPEYRLIFNNRPIFTKKLAIQLK